MEKLNNTKNSASKVRQKKLKTKMALTVVNKQHETIEALTFEDMDKDNEMSIYIDFKGDVWNKSLNLTLTKKQVEALIRHSTTQQDLTLH